MMRDRILDREGGHRAAGVGEVHGDRTIAGDACRRLGHRGHGLVALDLEVLGHVLIVDLHVHRVVPVGEIVEAQLLVATCGHVIRRMPCGRGAAGVVGAVDLEVGRVAERARRVGEREVHDAAPGAGRAVLALGDLADLGMMIAVGGLDELDLIGVVGLVAAAPLTDRLGADDDRRRAGRPREVAAELIALAAAERPLAHLGVVAVRVVAVRVLEHPHVGVRALRIARPGVSGPGHRAVARDLGGDGRLVRARRAAEERRDGHQTEQEQCGHDHAPCLGSERVAPLSHSRTSTSGPGWVPRSSGGAVSLSLPTGEATNCSQWINASRVPRRTHGYGRWSKFGWQCQLCSEINKFHHAE